MVFKLIVLDLARGIPEAEMREMFTPFGKVESCALVMDKEKGTSKGFGFVEMETKAAAEAAIAELSGKKFQGSKIRVKFSEPKKF